MPADLETTSEDVAPQANEPTDPRITSDRAWQIALHEESVLNVRVNFFFVGQSMLIAAFLSGRSVLPAMCSHFLIGCGVILTLLWMVINRKQYCELEAAKHLLQVSCSEYSIYREHVRSFSKKHRIVRATDIAGREIVLIAFGVPAVFGLLWTGFFLADFGLLR